VLKREVHRQALVPRPPRQRPKFFLGTDSAPHPAHLKEHAVAAPAATPRRRRWSCTPRPSSRRRAGQARRLRQLHHGPTSTACRATPARVTLRASPGCCPRPCPSATPCSSRCAAATP
jgi:dihydroorotase